jgi:hypothetical protein
VTLQVDLRPVAIDGADEFVAYVLESEFFRDPVGPGDRAVASWQIDEIHPLGGDGRSAEHHWARSETV